MKITDLLPEAVDLELKHPVSGELLGVSLKVVGPDSIQFRTARNALIKRKMDGAQSTPEEMIANNDELLASLVVGWSNDEFFDGPYSPAKVKELIANPGLAWLREQIDNFTETRANFFRKGS